MSAPDCYLVGSDIPMPFRFDGYPHCLAVLPVGMTVAQIGDPGSHVAGVFLVDPDCAAIAMNDSALERYICTKTPVFLHAARARDLRPFLRRADAFKRRGARLEVIAVGK